MPRLKAEQIPPTTGPFLAPVRQLREGEERVTCPVDDACGWSEIRPGYAVWSAREGHRIGHEKGWF